MDNRYFQTGLEYSLHLTRTWIIVTCRNICIIATTIVSTMLWYWFCTCSISIPTASSTCRITIVPWSPWTPYSIDWNVCSIYDPVGQIIWDQSMCTIIDCSGVNMHHNNFTFLWQNEKQTYHTIRTVSQIYYENRRNRARSTLL